MGKHKEQENPFSRREGGCHGTPQDPAGVTGAAASVLGHSPAAMGEDHLETGTTEGQSSDSPLAKVPKPKEDK